MSEEFVLTPEENLNQLSDLLIQSIIKTDDVSLQNRKYLFSNLLPRVFRNENFVIFNTFYNFKDKGITPDETFIKMYLMRNIKFIIKNKEYIDLQSYKDLDDDINSAYISAVLKQYTRLMQLDVLDFETFKLNIEKYKNEFSNYEINKSYSQAKIILYDGLQVGNKLYQGYDDSVAYVKNKIAEIESMLNQTTGAGFIDSRVTAIEDEEVVKPIKIGDFGLIKELNEHLGGLYTSLFYNIMAPTKNGKSKFSARLMHNIAVEHGVNISVWAHEGGYQAWWAQLRAIHFEYLYIRNKDANSKLVKLSQDDILKDNYPSEDIKKLENASKLDLFTNPSYGNIYMIDRPFEVDTFIDEIETSVQLNNSKAVLVDYLQLISWDAKKLSKSQAIGSAYQKALAYAKKRNILFMSPSQFTQEFMKELASTKEGQQHEIRTAGGESSEIIRTPDVNIALYATTEDLIRNQMTLMSVPSRMSSPFPDTRIYADLCSCVFSSIENE